MYVPFLSGGGGLLDLQGPRPSLQVVVVVALVKGHPIGIYGQDLVDGLVQESPVVGGYQDAAGEGSKAPFEPDVGFQVQVVGGFVQQKEVGVPEEYPGEARPHHPAAAEFVHGPEEIAVPEPQARQDGLGLVLPDLAASGFDGGVETAEPVKQKALPFRVGFRGQGVAHCANLGDQGIQFRGGAQDLLQEGFAGEGVGFLLKVPQGGVPLP